MISEQDKEFLRFVKEHSDMGYGRMMQIISYAWYTWLEREYSGSVKEGAFVANTCMAFLSDDEKQGYLEILALEKYQGMDY